MHCPQCKGYRLEPKLLEPNLLAASCAKCNGALVPLLNYRHWSENHCDEHDVNKVDEVSIAAEDSPQAKLCPKCGRMMTKFRIGLDSNNRIDLCGSCDEAWLDNGEWQLLKQLELHYQLPKIFTEGWQRNIRQQRQQQRVQAKYTELLGEESFNKVDQFKSWVDKHPQKDQIKQYLIISFD